MPDLLILQEMIACMNEEKPIRVVIQTKSDTKIRRSKDLFGTVQHEISNVNGNDKAIYGLKIHVESAPGVWIDVMRFSRLGLQEKAKEGQNTEIGPRTQK